MAQSATPPPPRLVFSKSDLPTLKARIQTPDSADAWKDILARATAHCTPGDPGYVDPEKVGQGPQKEVKAVLLGHYFGRPLTAWLEALGLAYQLTGEERFARHGVAVVEAAARKLPVTDPRVAGSFAGARGDIMRGLALGYDWLAEAMTEEQKRLWQETAAGYVRNILAEAHSKKAWWFPNHNFMGVAVGAAGCLAIELREAFPEESPQWQDDCAALIRKWLDSGFDEQGAYAEGTLYGVYGLSNAILFADALRRNGGPDLFDHPRLRQVPQFYALSLLPGESVFDARNDASYSGLGDPAMLRLAGTHRCGLAKWLWQRCRVGNSAMQIVWANDVPPVDPVAARVPLSEHFSGRGLCIFRTGWKKDDVMFSIECGPFYRGTHNQADKGHFTLYGLGSRWAVDSGYGNNQEPEGRAQTVAHNCVLIDGKGQALSGAGLGTSGKILAYADDASHGYVLADCAEAYNRNCAGKPGVGARRALRHALFVRPSHGVPAYAVVLDDTQKDDQEHDYTWLLHIAADMNVEIHESSATFRPDPDEDHPFVETPWGAQGQGECIWKLDVKQPGKYALWARVRAAGEVAQKSDSFIVQMDAGEPIQWHMPGLRDWTWGKVSAGPEQGPVVFDLTAGPHALRFKTRESGAQVMRVMLTADQAAQPPCTGSSQAIFLEAGSAQVAAPMRVVRPRQPIPPPCMKLHLRAAAQKVTFALDAYDGHPRLKATTRAVNPQFAALLLPLPAGIAEPEVNFETTAEGARIQVKWKSRADVLLWPHHGDRKPRLTQSVPN